jgi:lysophospholipase L1-like esterase
VAGEAFLRAKQPLRDPYEASRLIGHYIRREHKPNMHMVFTPEHGLPGMRGINHWTTNNLGFRGVDIDLKKPENEYRIFLIGGSTTECLILDDKDSLDAVLQSELQQMVGDNLTIRVYNAGISGDRSDDHIAILSQRIVHLEPDFIVVFSGINDLHAAIEGHDYLHLPTPGIAPWKLLAAQSQLGRLAYWVLAGHKPPINANDQEPIETGYRVGVEAQRLAPEATSPPRTDIGAYRKNLNTLAGIAHGQAIPMILMTQQTTWDSTVDPSAKDWHWMLRVADLRYSEESMNDALMLLNDVMRQVGGKKKIDVYDLAEDIPKSSEYFYDDVHFNTKGAAFAGKQLAAKIAPHIYAVSLSISE